MTVSFEIFSDLWVQYGEGPVWSESGNCIWWVDIPGCRLLRTDAVTGRTDAWNTPETPGCIAVRADGMLVVGLVSGIFLFDPVSGRFEHACSPESRDDVRFNDGASDAAGRFWTGTMHLAAARPAGAIFCIEPDFTYRRIFEDLWIPNGLAFDQSRNRMYFSDSHPSVQTIWVCDYDVLTGTPVNRRTFATTHALEGRPDGAFVDDDGVYWIAAVEGSQLLRFAPTGEALEPLPVPVSHPTKIVMDRKNPPTLYVTTRRMAPDDETDPSGYLLRGTFS
ncbi:SMP-30/gluconolactonase/LRE family protein [Phyllobacterium leguminum]|uniref:Gluconolactonase n=1 Tax=Phyllobacterium leguminum TaxID=314237 RepID=A0A318TLD9_9HYPH|nr:SMP-30/gluconolactonase/LRE family protein [Phyllobacterium leguminum]PYE90376.1 gluconolactonase [Phyllobacterium leguminum]